MTKAKTKRKTKPKGKAGRPRMVLTEEQWRYFDLFCKVGASKEDLAEAMQCDAKTCAAICRRDKGIELSEYMQKKRGQGRCQLRAKQFEVAMNGDKTLLIWLGKQWLGQADKPDDLSSQDAVFELCIADSDAPSDDEDQR